MRRPAALLVIVALVAGALWGEPIQSPHDLTRRVAGTPPGSKVTLRVARGDGEASVEATLGRLRDTAPARPGAER